MVGERQLLLPDRARLLYIGPMKTGTTSIQYAARTQRASLLDLGVRYPGRRLNHRRQLGALMGWSVNVGERAGVIEPDLLNVAETGIPPRADWDELKAEIDADTTRRALITHEFVSQARDDILKRIVEELGPDRIHVAITLRAPAAIVPSLWAQGIKDDGQAQPFERWVNRIYGDHPADAMSARFWRAYNQGELVGRWARLIGPENVTVVITDKSRPNLLTDAFEAMLGLPIGTLRISEPSNRSMTVAEAEMLRNVNERLHEEGVGWDTFLNFGWRGAVNAGLMQRTPNVDEPRLQLPVWAAEFAHRDGVRFAERIRSSGVRVVGDLENLHAETHGDHQPPTTTIPVDVAGSALAGSMLAAERVRRSTDKSLSKAKRAAKRASDLQKKAEARPLDSRPTRELAGAIFRRLRHKFGVDPRKR